MKKIAYQVIFGNSWGSGHLNRAIAFRQNILNPTEIFAVLERSDDLQYIERYKVPYTSNTLTGRDEDYDLVIDDTLGMFTDRAQEFDETWIIDGVRLGEPCQHFNGKGKCWSILYPGSGPQFPRPEFFFKKAGPCAAVFQGGGDDHRQIRKIVERLPADHSLIIGVGSNCRHIKELERVCETRGKAALMVNFDVRRIARAADYVITSGGNILYELYYMTQSQNLVLFSKEEKEHLTFSQFAGSSRVRRYFLLQEDFKYDASFLPETETHVASKRSIEEIGLI